MANWFLTKLNHEKQAQEKKEMTFICTICRELISIGVKHRTSDGHFCCEVCHEK